MEFLEAFEDGYDPRLSRKVEEMFRRSCQDAGVKVLMDDSRAITFDNTTLEATIRLEGDVTATQLQSLLHSGWTDDFTVSSLGSMLILDCIVKSDVVAQ